MATNNNQKTKPTLELAQPMPSATETEEIIIGAMLIEGSAYDTVKQYLNTEEIFYEEKYRIVFRAIKQLATENTAIDLITVSGMLRKQGMMQHLTELVGSMSLLWLSELTNKVSGAANIETWALQLKEYHIRRRLIVVSEQMKKAAYDETQDILELLDKQQTLLGELAQVKQVVKEQSVSEIINEVQAKLRKKEKAKIVEYKFRQLRKSLGAFQGGDLIIIAGRPGMGKTSLAVQILNDAADLGTPAAFFSLEMKNRSIVARQLSGDLKVPVRSIMDGSLSDADIDRIDLIKGKYNIPFYYDDSSSLNIQELRAKIRKMVLKYKIGLVAIDYLQLMEGEEGKNTTREQVISKISRGLKQIALELDIPVIAMSQLSRDVEKRDDKRPVLSDLRESGGIEQDADAVVFVYRPEVYNATKDTYVYGKPVNPKGVAELIIAKNRNGKPTTVPMCFYGEYTRFSDWAEQTTIEAVQTQIPVHEDPEMPF